MKITLRNIQKEEAEQFREIRLEGLLNDPGAFSSSYEEDVHKSVDYFKERIGDTEDYYIVGAYDENDRLVGTAGFLRESKLKLRHKATIWGVFVSPGWRNQGIGKQLMEEIISRSRRLANLTQINLTVMLSNDAATRLYESLGFQTFGIEKNALRMNDVFYDETLMTLHLRA